MTPIAQTAVADANQLTKLVEYGDLLRLGRTISYLTGLYVGDICPTGGLALACFTFVGAVPQSMRFIALQPKDERARLGTYVWRALCEIIRGFNDREKQVSPPDI